MADNKMTHEEILEDMERIDKENGKKDSFFKRLVTQGGLTEMWHEYNHPGQDATDLAEIAIGYDIPSRFTEGKTATAVARGAGDIASLAAPAFAAGLGLKVVSPIVKSTKAAKKAKAAKNALGLGKKKGVKGLLKKAVEKSSTKKLAKSDEVRETAMNMLYEASRMRAEAASLEKLDKIKYAGKIKDLYKEATKLSNPAEAMLRSGDVLPNIDDLRKVSGDFFLNHSNGYNKGFMGKTAAKLVPADMIKLEPRASRMVLGKAFEGAGTIGSVGTTAAVLGEASKTGYNAYNNKKEQTVIEQGSPISIEEKDFKKKQKVLDKHRAEIDIQLTKKYIESFAKWDKVINGEDENNEAFFEEFNEMKNKDDRTYIDWLLSEDVQYALRMIRAKPELVEREKAESDPLYEFKKKRKWNNEGRY